MATRQSELLPCRLTALSRSYCMASQPANLPQDLLQSLIVPERVPKAAHKLVQICHTESGNLSHQPGSSLLEQKDQPFEAEKTEKQGERIRKPTMSEKEIDFDLAPPDSPVHTPVTDFKTPYIPVGKPGHTYSVEEWDAMFPAPKKLGPKPTPFSTPSGPVPLPQKSANPEAIPRFNHLCQVHSLTSSFTFEEVEQGLFSSKLVFGDYVYEEEGPFPSKKLAKEAVALRGLGTLENIEPSLLKDGKLELTKRKSSDEDATESPDEPRGDWVATLHAFAQKRHHIQPQFQYFEVDTRSKQRRGLCNSSSQFCCTLNVQARPDHTFGSNTIPHVTKAEAKRSAAKEAVTWLQVVGMLPDAASTKPAKRRKSTSDGGHAGLTQEVSRLMKEQSPSQLVVELSLRMGLSQPQYKCEPTGQNFYICTAHYLGQDVLRQPQLEGSLCQTDSVFGQKNAKRMCAQDLLAMLERLMAERESE